MRQILTSKQISHMISILLILLIATLLLMPIFLLNVEATSLDELIIEDLSNENQISTRYSNIQGFLGTSQSRTSNYSLNNKIRQLYDALNISKDDLAGIDEASLLNARSITVSDTLIVANEDGTYESRAVSYTNAKDYPDIVNDNGSSGYMAGRIVVVQSADYDKVDKNKDGEITKFLAYGFECAFSMNWLKKPTYTMKDYFTFAASNGAFTEEDSSLVFTADAYFYDNQDPSRSYSYQDTPEVSKYYQSGWPYFTFNLPTNVAATAGSITYSNYRLSSRARLYALEDFNIIMAYAHKQLVTGDLSVSISISGLSVSISFGGTSNRKYETPNFFIDLIKDPAMEALKE